jgi:cytoskeletal protein CcmA (bactofilin family)
MSIFRRETDEPRPAAAGAGSHPSPPAPAPERRPQQAATAGAAGTTHIATGAKITGQVNGTSDLVVDGELEGQVRLESHVTIGPSGKVQGDIVAKSVRIGGRVVGNVHGHEKVEILPSGRLEGDVAAPRVVLAEGAFFKGKVEMTGGQKLPGPGLTSGAAPPKPEAGA